ncbi:Protein of unknown function [Streptococcus thermophilus]|nr:Protein of unknown function [Streptococcus thermophilus]
MAENMALVVLSGILEAK